MFFIAFNIINQTRVDDRRGKRSIYEASPSLLAQCGWEFLCL